MSKWACRYCIASKGLTIADMPDIDDNEAIAKHIEGEHHIPVRRPDETPDECMARFAREQPDAGGPNCKCPNCGDPRHALVDAMRAITQENP